MLLHEIYYTNVYVEVKEYNDYFTSHFILLLTLLRARNEAR